MDIFNEKEVKRLFNAAPYIVNLGLGLDSIADGECHSSLEINKHHLQQDGFVHAGVQATMADHTAGAAAATQITQGQIVLTAEFKINLLRSAKGSHLRCVSKVLKAGRTLIVLESEVYCHDTVHEYLVSKATVTLTAVSPRQGAK